MHIIHKCRYQDSRICMHKYMIAQIFSPVYKYIWENIKYIRKLCYNCDFLTHFSAREREEAFSYPTSSAARAMVTPPEISSPARKRR